MIPPQNSATVAANPVVLLRYFKMDNRLIEALQLSTREGSIILQFHSIQVFGQTGTYNLYAKYLGNQVTTSFNVSDPFSTSSGGLRLIMITDTDKYLPGQTVLITGRTSSIISVQNVDLAIGMTNDTIISEGQVTSLTGITMYQKQFHLINLVPLVMIIKFQAMQNLVTIL